jgi:DNA-directed RNA polymerase specialized sigma24 family protein
MEPGPNELIELWLQGLKEASSAKAEAAGASRERHAELERLAAAAINKAEAARERLFTEHFLPVVRAKVGVRLSPSSDVHRDICQEVFERLTKKLQQLSVQTDHNGASSMVRKSNWRSYAEKIAFHCVVNHIRKQSQLWRSISGRLRYLVETQGKRFAIWRVDTQEVCGLSGWRDRPYVQLRSDDSRLADVMAGMAKPWPELVEKVLEIAAAPVRFDKLVALFHRYSVPKHETPMPVKHDEDDLSSECENLPATQPTSEYHAYLTQMTEHMWKSICSLPVEHRRALMLNLKGADGGDIQLVDYLKLASREEIARCVEIPENQFEKLWPELPLDDNKIAQMSGATRQQVINWRSAARERLKREMDGWHDAI